MREFVGKAVFVTGGASGIGLAIVRARAQWAITLVIHVIDRPSFWWNFPPQLTLLHGSVVRRRGLDGVSGPRF